jgi:hypothetical protein
VVGPADWHAPGTTEGQELAEEVAGMLDRAVVRAGPILTQQDWLMAAGARLAAELLQARAQEGAAEQSY